MKWDAEEKWARALIDLDTTAENEWILRELRGIRNQAKETNEYLKYILILLMVIAFVIVVVNWDAVF